MQDLRPEPGKAPDTMTAIAKQALSELASWDAQFSALLVEHFGEQAARDLREQVRRHFEHLLTLMPDPGWRAPQMRAFSLSGAVYIAYYLALKERGRTPAQVWELCERATRSRFLHMPVLSRRILSWTIFSALWKLLAKKLAQRSKKEPVGGWQVEYVPRSDGDFDYGVTYTRCAIHRLAQDAGAGEFAPFICQADTVGSEVFGWGLRRTETLAQGGPYCDFRFRRGGATDVRFKLPVIS